MGLTMPSVCVCVFSECCTTFLLQTSGLINQGVSILILQLVHNFGVSAFSLAAEHAELPLCECVRVCVCASCAPVAHRVTV